MKQVVILLFTVFLSLPVSGQHATYMRNLWTKPQVHVLFQDYTISFAIRDINKALNLMYENGDRTFGRACDLDTAGNYFYEIVPGKHMEYRNGMQAVLQNIVGPFLITSGRAVIINKYKRVLRSVITDILMPEYGEDKVLVRFTDPDTHELVFAGKIPVAVYKKDLGIDDD